MDKKTALWGGQLSPLFPVKKVSPGCTMRTVEDGAAPGLFLVQVTSHENVQESTALQESLLRSLGLSFETSPNSVKPPRLVMCAWVSNSYITLW